MNITGYVILTSEDPHELASDVERSIRLGWEPLGGVCVSQSDSHTKDHDGYDVGHFSRLFAQAMIKRTAPQNP